MTMHGVAAAIAGLVADVAAPCERGVRLGFVLSAAEPGVVPLREDAGPVGAMLERDRPLQVREVEHAAHPFAGASARRRPYAALDMLPMPASAFDPPRADASPPVSGAARP